jgi:hypothetical protein
MNSNILKNKSLSLFNDKNDPKNNIKLAILLKYKEKLNSKKFKSIQISKKCLNILIFTNKLFKAENLSFLIKIINNLFCSLQSTSKKG